MERAQHLRLKAFLLELQMYRVEWAQGENAWDQIYNGDILRGVFWLIVTPGFWIGTGGCLGWVCHIIAAATAHSRAEDQLKYRVTVV